MKNIILVLIMFVAFISCNDDDSGCEITPSNAGADQEQLAKDIGYIDEFLDQNGITAIEHESGLRYVVHIQGEGEIPEPCSTILANYSGHILNRISIFDQSDSVAFKLSNLIVGWQIGFTQLETGAKATLYIPSGLGYGVNGSGTAIPSNANLVFDIDLIDIYE